MNPTEFYQRLPTLRTERLLLRKLSMADASDYFAFAGDPQVTRYLRWGPHASLEVTESYLSGVMEAYQQGSDSPWGIELVQEHRLIGSTHLMEIDPHHRKAGVGVVLHSQYWRQGLGSEVLRRVLEFCFRELHLQRVRGLAIAGNTAACRMMEKCGMAREGLLRRYALQKGQWWDFDSYSILADEFCIS